MLIISPSFVCFGRCSIRWIRDELERKSKWRERDILLMALGLRKDAIYANWWDYDVSNVDNSQIHVDHWGVDRLPITKL